MITVPAAWQAWLGPIWNMHGPGIQAFLDKEEAVYGEALQILPPAHQIFRAFEEIAEGPEGVRVVILGQDPYPTAGHAEGLCFSVQEGQKMPPSLRNIFAELERAFGTVRTRTSLSDWAKQGILLLNTALTVREGGSGSHTKAWLEFTADVMTALGAASAPATAFLLWGAHAQSYRSYIDESRHKVWTHTHPSPLSRAPFVGCGHFEACNAWLASQGRPPIQWLDKDK